MCVGRQFYELASASTLIATEALARIAALYKIEGEIRGRSAEERRAVRQEHTRPLVAALEAWLREKIALISQKSTLAGAIRYELTRWAGLSLFLKDGRVEIDSDTVERSSRLLAINRKNALRGATKAKRILKLPTQYFLTPPEPAGRRG